MRTIRLILILIALVLKGQVVEARHEVNCSREDSIRVETLLKEALEKKPANPILFFARKFIGVRYVGKTLDRDANNEALVVNLNELDCTTYVETVTALAMTYKDGSCSFAEYTKHLKALRYEGGKVAYTKRNHYFTGWIDNSGLKSSLDADSEWLKVNGKQQTVVVNFMSVHPEYYPQLKSHPELLSEIKAMESRISGKKYWYIAKDKLSDSPGLRKTVKDGDIIAITTSKAGLDIAHVGFAVWHNNGLHLLNASQVHGKVVEEEMTLAEYMKGHPTQTGIRCIATQ